MCSLPPSGPIFGKRTDNCLGGLCCCCIGIGILLSPILVPLFIVVAIIVILFLIITSPITLSILGIYIMINACCGSDSNSKPKPKVNYGTNSVKVVHV